MENTDARAKTTDEVDISQFFRWIGNGFNRVGSGILYGMATLRNMFFKNLIFFGLVMITGIILAFVYSKLITKNYYRSTMVLNCSYLNTQILNNTIQKLNQLCDAVDASALKNELAIPDSVAEAILGFEYKSFVDQKDVIEMEVLKEQLTAMAANKQDIVDKIVNRLTIENKDAYEITVLVSNPTVYKTLESSLISYFRNNSYVSRRIEANKQLLLERKSKLIDESQKLDSLKGLVFGNIKSMARTERGSNNVILSDEANGNPLEIFQEDLRMHQEIQRIEHELYLQPDFELMEGFAAMNKPANPSMIRILFIACLISFVAAYLILFAWRFDRLLAKYPTND